MTGIEATKFVIDLLLSSSEFTTMLSSKSGRPELISGITLPPEWDITDKTVNIHVLSETTREEYYKIRLSASCRGNTYVDSRNIAYKLVDIINRYSVSGMLIVATPLATLDPKLNGIQNYLTSVEILLRSN